MLGNENRNYGFYCSLVEWLLTSKSVKILVTQWLLQGLAAWTSQTDLLMQYRFPLLFVGVTFLRNYDPLIPKPTFSLNLGCIFFLAIPCFLSANSKNRE